MKTIEVRDQVNLPLARCFQLCVRGIRYRLFRSAITVVIVSLAVAFLMMMLSTSYVDRQVGDDVRRRTSARRLLEQWVDRLSVPMTAETLTDELAADDLRAGTPPWQEFRQWGKLSDEQLAHLQAVARDERVVLRFLDRLKPEERSALIGSRVGQGRIAFLAEPDRLAEFISKVTAFPRDRAWLQRFVDEFTRAGGQRKAILTGHAQAVEGLKKDLGGEAVLELLSRSEAQVVQKLQPSGFLPSLGDLEKLRAQAVLALDAQKLSSLLRDERMRSLIASRVGTTVLQDRHVFRIAASREGARWLKREVETTRQGRLKAGDAGGRGILEPLDLPEERIVQVASDRLEQLHLAEVEATFEVQDEEGWLGFSARTGWLIIISFVVCVVGVANAMLMSVTERFREIATMKCLGALDSFIMVIFVMESSLQGLAGGLAGVVIGLILGVLRSLWGFGTLAISNLPALVLLGSAGACVAAGVVLAGLAALYPAWVAARLAPMEAMRIE